MTAAQPDDAGRGAPAPTPTRPSSRVSGRVRRRAAPAAPVARFEPGRVADARHRNPTWIVAGVLLVLLSALGGVLLYTSSDDRSEVLVAAVDIEPGRAVAASDLRIERVALDTGVRSIPAGDAGATVGQQTTGLIPAGTLLSPEMFDRAVALGPDEMVVGAALDPGAAPLSALDVGATVELLDVAAAGASATTLGTGVVWAVEPIATGELWVSVRVDRTAGIAVSEAAADDRLRVALVAGEP